MKIASQTSDVNILAIDNFSKSHEIDVHFFLHQVPYNPEYLFTLFCGISEHPIMGKGGDAISHYPATTAGGRKVKLGYNTALLKIFFEIHN